MNYSESPLDRLARSRGPNGSFSRHDEPILSDMPPPARARLPHRSSHSVNLPQDFDWSNTASEVGLVKRLRASPSLSNHGYSISWDLGGGTQLQLEYQVLEGAKLVEQGETDEGVYTWQNAMERGSFYGALLASVALVAKWTTVPAPEISRLLGQGQPERLHSIVGRCPQVARAFACVAANEHGPAKEQALAFARALRQPAPLGCLDGARP